ncbi:hypothetical protein MAIT1_00187 [Magnetofaba australis IT-1]|uniref:Uncharacterized protein n=1 Tax=Magnetofaba australis IT-1 TaxID=1434232 RepID=A0A1Y2K863_9PROT|nr:hypothetical protein MAIT1_00187 [Magnetofaba australis IT-1]
MRAGQRLTFAVERVLDPWFDRTIPIADPMQGAPSANLAMRLTEGLRPLPAAGWCALAGSIGRHRSAAFALGQTQAIVARHSGRLWIFANDLRLCYGNNRGLLTLRIAMAEPP